MYVISEDQIDYILADIAAQGVTDEHLQNNILDHVCCLLENSAEPILDFEASYRKHIESFYKNNLKEIEVEANLLINFKHYYLMKKFMLLSGMIGAGILLLGNLFKFMHWPGAAILLLTGITLLALIFIPIMFYLKIKENQSVAEKIFLSVGLILASAFCLSVLFKLLHWPGANLLGNISLFGAILVFSPLYLVYGFKSKDNRTNVLITTILIISAAGMLYSLIAIRISRTVQESSWMVVENNHKSNENFRSLCLNTLSKDSTQDGKEKYQNCLSFLQKSDSLKWHVIYTATGISGNTNYNSLMDVNPNDLIIGKLLPTDNSQVRELIQFEAGLNQIYGSSNQAFDIEWAKQNIFGLRISEIFIRINDIERDALLYALK
ncbi:MAG: hypothetical protein K9H61_03230 [Bacteroidia bacterium]|nr:hypothetical protein [Bacteroidia bacterium]MCF8427255.1 hypothetical protein [Bacteroidia bacterium]MCF8445985.1 hypothetical protein [Bacteroidia bacterium]